jgi:hypothetical protein
MMTVPIIEGRPKGANIEADYGMRWCRYQPRGDPLTN